MPHLAPLKRREYNAQRMRQWRSRNRERLRTREREWWRKRYHSDPHFRSKKNEAKRQWRLRNPAKYRAYSHRYYLANKKKWADAEAKRRSDPQFRSRTNKYIKRWRSNNLAWREKAKLWAHNRRARIAKSGGAFTVKEWTDLCRKYHHRCAMCHKKRKLTQDHIIPLSKGGSNFISNIQPLCHSCNSKKGAKLCAI